MHDPERRTTPDRRNIDENTVNWRTSISDQLCEFTAKLEIGDERMCKIERQLQENTAATNKAAADTSELLDILISFKGAFKVFDFIGRLAKPVGAIAFAATTLYGLWTAIKTGLHLK